MPSAPILAKARNGNILLAYKMNGVDLSSGASEISTDGGQNWNKAQLTGPSVRYAWRLWEHVWRTPSPAIHANVARATEATRSRWRETRIVGVMKSRMCSR